MINGHHDKQSGFRQFVPVFCEAEEIYLSVGYKCVQNEVFIVEPVSGDVGLW